MSKGRLEAFSDGVFAVIITIMVFNIKAPQAPTFTALLPVLPAFLSYALSFLYVGIYWNNHHHLLHAAEHVSGTILWCNLHLLFWLSLAPFATAWIGQNPRNPAPAALYGVILLCAAIAYFILTRGLIADHRADSRLALSVGKDAKGQWSIVVYIAAIPLAFLRPWAAYACYTLVAVLWLLPDRRIEKVVHD
jgi:uncharacterized membrane protein